MSFMTVISHLSAITYSDHPSPLVRHDDWRGNLSKVYENSRLSASNSLRLRNETIFTTYQSDA